MRVAVKPRLLAATVGGQRAATAVARSIALHPPASPLFSVGYDFPRLFEIAQLSAPPFNDPKDLEVMRRAAKVIGFQSMWVTATPKGLVIDMSME